MKTTTLSTFCAVVFSFITMSANSALIGVLPVTPGGEDWQAYYDDVADLTWLANANAAVGSVYDTWTPGSGRMEWDDAMAWVAGLNVGGVTGWRLAMTDTGYRPGSEMDNLFYNVLGGQYNTSITTTHNSNYDLFSNVQSFPYWSATEWVPPTTPDMAWVYNFMVGDQTFAYKIGNGLNAWAVHSGAVPVPAAVWLFSSGLLALVGVGKRHRH